MTSQEQKTVDALYKVVFDLRMENDKFREDVTKQVSLVTEKIEQKHLPLSLENEVLHTLTDSMRSAFQKVLSDNYNSPLKKYAENVIAKYQRDIEGVFDVIVSEGIRTPEFKESIRQVFLHKLAKTVLSGIDGSIDKTVNQMKQDTVFRSRLTLFVNGLVEEYIQNK